MNRIFCIVVLFFLQCGIVLGDSSAISGQPNTPTDTSEKKEENNEARVYSNISGGYFKDNTSIVIKQSQTARKIDSGIMKPLEDLDKGLAEYTKKQGEDDDGKRIREVILWQNALVIALKVVLFLCIFLIFMRASASLYRGDTNGAIMQFVGLAFLICVILTLPTLISTLSKLVA